MDDEYTQWVVELKQRVKNAQIKAAVRVNRELINLYWSIGQDIVERKIDFPRQSASEVTFVGKVKDIEYKNDKRYLYLSGVEVVEDERNMEAFKSQVRKYVNNMTCDAFIE